LLRGGKAAALVSQGYGLPRHRNQFLSQQPGQASGLEVLQPKLTSLGELAKHLALRHGIRAG
jgi:hypothetical protein